MNRQTIRSRWFCCLPLLPPLAFCLYVIILHDGVKLYISELNLSISSDMFSGLCLSVTLLWTSCLTDLRSQCCRHWLSAIGFHMLPITLLCLLIFAQHEFFLSLLLSLLVMGGLLMLPRIGPHHRRLIVTICTILLLFPTIVVIFEYRMRSPIYEVEEQLFTELQEEYESLSVNKKVDPLMKDKDLLQSLAPNRWQDWSILEKTVLLQRFLAYQSQSLGLRDVPKLTVETLDGLWGQYYPDTNRIALSTEIVDSGVVQAIYYSAHELFHQYTLYITTEIEKTIGWDSPLAKTPYFSLAQDWRDNYRYYISPGDNLQKYAEQPLEESANQFAEHTVMQIQTLWEAEALSP